MKNPQIKHMVEVSCLTAGVGDLYRSIQGLFNLILNSLSPSDQWSWLVGSSSCKSASSSLLGLNFVSKDFKQWTSLGGRILKRNDTALPRPSMFKHPKDRACVVKSLHRILTGQEIST